MKRISLTILIALPALASTVIASQGAAEFAQALRRAQAQAAAQPAVPESADGATQQALGEMAQVAIPPAAPRPLTLELPQSAQSKIPRFGLGPLEDAFVEAADAENEIRFRDFGPGPRRVGIVRAIEPAFTMADFEPVATTEDGRTVWALEFTADCAIGMRVHISALDLKQAELIIYGYEGNDVIVRGPYNGQTLAGREDFWSTTIPGELVAIEVVAFEPPDFAISEFAHLDQDPSAGESGVPMGSGCGAPGSPGLSCNLDVMCESGLNTIARQSVAQMMFVKGGQCFVCTGTLLVDRDPGTQVPFFLTADHCIDNQTDWLTLEAVFGWQTDFSLPSSTCATPVRPSWSALPRLTGERLLTGEAAVFGNDHSFGRLQGDLHPIMGFAGWSTDQESGEYGIHHPAGSPKRVTFGHYVGLSTDCGADCGCFTPINYAFYVIDRGVIQGGSSGSGMFNGQGQLIGQLFGHCTLCPDAEDCAHAGDWCLMYGDFEDTWDDIEFHIERGGTMHVDRANTSSPWDGSEADPYRRVIDGMNALWGPNLRVLIRPGNYPENIVLNREARLETSGGLVRIGS